MNAAHSPPADATLTILARLVVKDRVGLGGLGLSDRDLALGLVWAALPPGMATEAEVNQRLKLALAGPACWLDTDHVELRRWLVDTDWMRRDGFSRAYERVSAADLRAGLQPLAAVLGGLDVSAWVADARLAHQRARAAREQAWRRQA